MFRTPPRDDRSPTIYRSEEAERRIKQQYRRMVDELGASVSRRWVETPTGVTHMLTAGDTDAPPLVIFHGGNSINPITFRWFLPLADRYQLLAPDTPGQPGFSSQRRLDPNEAEFADWITAVLDELALERAPMVGVSYGAGILLRTATYHPERIERAALIVPAGLGTGPFIPMARELLWPTLRHRVIPSREHLEAAIQPLFTEPVDVVDPAVIDAISAVLDGVKIERRLPPAATAAELADFEASTLVAAASEDVLFPPETVIPRARDVLTNLEVVMHLRGERHIPSPQAIEKVRRYLRTFLEDDTT